MKKIILAISLMAVTYSSAGIVEDKVNLVRQETYKQDVLADAIESYIQHTGTVPADLAAIKTANLISSTFSFTGSFAVDTSDYDFTITSTIAGPEVYQTDFYLNNLDRSRAVSPSTVTTSFTTEYYLNAEAIYSYTLASSTTATVSKTAPGSPSSGDVWMNSQLRQIYFYTGSAWLNLNPKKLYILRSTASLPTASSENDGAIVHTGAAMSKHIYSAGTWYTIPEAIPFTYNGQF